MKRIPQQPAKQASPWCPPPRFQHWAFPRGHGTLLVIEGKSLCLRTFPQAFPGSAGMQPRRQYPLHRDAFEIRLDALILWLLNLNTIDIECR